MAEYMWKKADGTPFAFSFCARRNCVPVAGKVQTIKNIFTMIKPLADRVVIEPKEAETRTASGLFIPDNAKEKPQQGKVVAVGPGKKDEPMEVKVGDNVLYGKYAGTEITVDGKDYMIMKQSDVLAIL